MTDSSGSEQFTGKRILVTGASRGIGKGIALKLASLGADVFAVGTSAEHLQKLQQENSRIHPIQVNLSDWDATRRAVEAVLPIDLLVNNAATFVHESFLQITEQGYERQMGVNLKAVINVSQIVAKSLIDRKIPGSIVNVSSICAQVALHDETVYCASKAALDAVTRSMALELGPHKIRVNSILPNLILTDMAMEAGYTDPTTAKPFLDRTPLGRLGDVDDCVNAVVFLLSDRSKFITGVHLPIDGGFLAT
ncbi:L-xylulose reductase-like [Paramacrobiotus metropolitanus]|uniref:L-xylulose reductase-like n=1 Tax=Paramacrobiotus metropolitanus TaxID=2943436 RepID=UPI002445E1E3|nr:L-xylulose reductase-like [Paramacrobiotus metropolitanus]